MMFLLSRNCSGYFHNSQQKRHVLHLYVRTYVEGRIRWVPDRGLDHAVERERYLRPVLNIKDLIKSDPSKSVPLPIITEKREVLRIPKRPIDLIRSYPSIFEEFLPGGGVVHPRIRLTPEVLELDAEEKLTHEREDCRRRAADQLVKLLMISRVHKIPLSVIDKLIWDLGLPEDYVQTVVPDFPDYFRVVGDKNLASGLEEDTRVLELVCWDNELATSVLEKMAAKGKTGASKGMPLRFPTNYSTGFEMDEEYKARMKEWEKLPYISPYENALHLSASSDESDRWAVAILHELLHMFVAKKIEKETVLWLGEYFGLRGRFKRALLNHPGIFYVSDKNRTYTVVLKEAYKRGAVIENSPVLTIRNKYLHLMNIVMGDSKTKDADSDTPQQKNGQKEQSDDATGKENEAEFFDSSDKEDEEDEESEDDSSYHNVRAGRKEAVGGRRGRANFNDRSNLYVHADRAEAAGGRGRRADFYGSSNDRKEAAGGRRRNADFYDSNNNNVRADRKEAAGGRRRHSDFYDSDNHNVHADQKEAAGGRRGNADFYDSSNRNFHADRKEAAGGRRGNADVYDSSNRNFHADRKEAAGGRRRHSDVYDSSNRNFLADRKEAAGGRRRHSNVYDSSNHNVRADRKEAAGGRRRHAEFQENAGRNRVRSSNRMDSTSGRPSRDVKRERSNDSKRYPVGMKG